MESKFAEKDLGILVDRKLNVSQQSTLMAKADSGITGCIRSIVASK